MFGTYTLHRTCLTDEAVEMNPPGTGEGRRRMELNSGRVTVTADGRRTRNMSAVGVSDHQLTGLGAQSQTTSF